MGAKDWLLLLTLSLLWGGSFAPQARVCNASGNLGSAASPLQALRCPDTGYSA